MKTQIRQAAESAPLAVRSKGRILFLQPEEVDWVEAKHNHVLLHTRRGGHLVRESMRAMEAKLDPHRFRRIHRGAIVNIGRIAAIEPRPRGDAFVALEGGLKLNVSRSYWKSLKQPV
ncbi:MAG: LytTR family transcriptional regulator [Bryobacter sp.]|nr:LytTR family transcriptional regulator [Bryobacter sp. CoA8 C33]